jgi:uncharacterized RDD family membrane protein YckC
MSLLQVKTPFNIELQFETAPFHFRLFAWMIDIFLLLLFLWGMTSILDKTMGISLAADFGFVELLLTTPFIIYHLVFEVFNKGQSIGKLAMGIQVIGLSGEMATVSQLLLRWLIRFIDFGFIWGFIFLAASNTFLGVVMVLGCIASFILFVSTPYSQRLGDVVAGTSVVLKRLPYKLSDTIFQDVQFDQYVVSFPQVMKLSDKDINIVDNIVKHHTKSNVGRYVENVANKIKTVLHIESDMPDDMFLETLLRDYNYLSRK